VKLKTVFRATGGVRAIEEPDAIDRGGAVEVVEGVPGRVSAELPKRARAFAMRARGTGSAAPTQLGSGNSTIIVLVGLVKARFVDDPADANGKGGGDRDYHLVIAAT
jgi:hypothetical protein